MGNLATVQQLKSLSELNPGETGIIDRYTDPDVELKMLDMGCTPGEPVIIRSLAPLGDPMLIAIEGYQLAIRRTEAAFIIIRNS